MQFELIFFDLDGTLADTSEDIMYCANLTLNELGQRERPLEEIKKAIGGGARMLMERLLVNTNADIDKAVKRFIDSYRKNPIKKTVLYPGVKETLTVLTQKKLVLTNKPESITNIILEKLEIKHLFNAIIGGDTYPTKKPDPMAINLMLDRFKIKPQNALMIGDTLTDIQTAHMAGLKCAAVSYGYSLNGEIKTADWIINSFEEIVSSI